MPKFIGTKNGKIQVISDKSFNSEYLTILELPSTLENIPVEKLILEYVVKEGKISHKNERRNLKDIKIAIITNFMSKCGLSTYMENLLNAMAPLLGNFKLFIEHNEQPTGPLTKLADHTLREDQIVGCWKRGEKLDQLVTAIKEYDPDIVFINHEFGLFPNARYFLALMTQLNNYRVIGIMHSTFHHRDKTICEAAIPEIVVHLEGAKKILQEEKGLANKIYVIPHGCSPCDNKERLWNLYKSEMTFVMSGFGFRYKNFQAALEATFILKEKYPNVFFTGLFSESPYSQLEHQKYYDELMEMIHKFGIENNVALIRGYQSDESLDSFLRVNKVALFPYVSIKNHGVQGASGGARLAMSKGIPVVSTSIPHFSDLPTIKADTPELMAAVIEKLCLKKGAAVEQVEKQNKFLEANSWKVVAEYYKRICEAT